ncbi:hypothetical protein B0H10DRAFT_2428464, partial [Mycena sp. CBHHK59/15]
MDKSFKLRPSRCRLLTDGNGWRDLHQMFSSYPYRCLANPSALSPHFFQALKIFRLLLPISQLQHASPMPSLLNVAAQPVAAD